MADPRNAITITCDMSAVESAVEAMKSIARKDPLFANRVLSKIESGKPMFRIIVKGTSFRLETYAWAKHLIAKHHPPRRA